MKVVINRRYGGFGLSPAAIERYAAIKDGRPVYHYVHAKDRDYDYNVVYRKSAAELTKEVLVYSIYKDLGPMIDRTELNRTSSEHWFCRYDLDRADPALVQTVEEMGPAANGPHASLKIVEIPDGVEYDIDKYEGLETIRERHRTWN